MEPDERAPLQLLPLRHHQHQKAASVLSGGVYGKDHGKITVNFLWLLLLKLPFSAPSQVGGTWNCGGRNIFWPAA